MVDYDISLSEKMVKLSRLVLRGQTDATKVDKGNIRAGIRLRKHLQIIRRTCKDLRDEVQMIREVKAKVKKEKQRKGW